MSETPPTKRLLTMINPVKKLTDEDLETIKLRYCAGEKAKDIAIDFSISPNTIKKYASRYQWPTPSRTNRALTRPQEYPVTDPAAALADIWSARKAEERENTYNGSRKALTRFWAHSPVPQTFAEAKIAQDMLNKAIDPDEQSGTMKANINLAVLTQSSFEPRPVRGREV